MYKYVVREVLFPVRIASSTDFYLFDVLICSKWKHVFVQMRTFRVDQPSFQLIFPLCNVLLTCCSVCVVRSYISYFV